jgi:anti-sigma B factor antagonist
MPDDHLHLDQKDGAAPGQRVIVLTGALTISTLFAFQDLVHADKSETLIVDMTNVPYIDSAGLGSLITAYVARQREARRLALVGVNERVKMVMLVSSVDKYFQMFDSVSEAEKTLSGARS